VAERRRLAGCLGKGKLDEQHGDVVVEVVAGMGAKPAQQFVGSRLEDRPVQSRGRGRVRNLR
jgi:hypothetical protein